MGRERETTLSTMTSCWTCNWSTSRGTSKFTACSRKLKIALIASTKKWTTTRTAMKTAWTMLSNASRRRKQVGSCRIIASQQMLANDYSIIRKNCYQYNKLMQFTIKINIIKNNKWRWHIQRYIVGRCISKCLACQISMLKMITCLLVMHLGSKMS